MLAAPFRMSTTSWTPDAISDGGLDGSLEGLHEVAVASQEKAKKKMEVVQNMIRSIEECQKLNTEEARSYLYKLVDPRDASFRVLVMFAVSPKYATSLGQVYLRFQCIVLRALQMILRLAVTIRRHEGIRRGDHPDACDVGMMCFMELVGNSELAQQAFRHLTQLAMEHEDLVLAIDALLVLAEMGREALSQPALPMRMFDLHQDVLDRADELSEVALRLHSYGGKWRADLLEATLTHPGGKLLGEVLMHMVNRGDEQRQIRAVKILTDCLSMPSGDTFLYTNDVKVLVEILMREMQSTAEDSAAVANFLTFADCLQALVTCSVAAREHRHQEMVQVLGYICEARHLHSHVRGACSKVLAIVGP